MQNMNNFPASKSKKKNTCVFESGLAHGNSPLLRSCAILALS
jgi:hypothetical protein